MGQFDISTAKPVADTTSAPIDSTVGFDISTAKPVQQDGGFLQSLGETLAPEPLPRHENTLISNDPFEKMFGKYKSSILMGAFGTNPQQAKGTAELATNIVSVPSRLLYAGIAKATGRDEFNKFLANKGELGRLLLTEEGNFWGKLLLDIVGDPVNYISGKGILKILGKAKNIEEGKSILKSLETIAKNPEIGRRLKQGDLEKVFNSPEAIAKIEKINAEQLLKPNRKKLQKDMNEVFGTQSARETMFEQKLAKQDLDNITSRKKTVTRGKEIGEPVQPPSKRPLLSEEEAKLQRKITKPSEIELQPKSKPSMRVTSPAETLVERITSKSISGKKGVTTPKIDVGEGIKIKPSPPKIEVVKKLPNRKVSLGGKLNPELALLDKIKGKGSKADQIIKDFARENVKDQNQIIDRLGKMARSDSPRAVEAAQLKDMLKQATGRAKASPIETGAIKKVEGVTPKVENIQPTKTITTEDKIDLLGRQSNSSGNPLGVSATNELDKLRKTTGKDLLGAKIQSGSLEGTVVDDLGTKLKVMSLDGRTSIVPKGNNIKVISHQRGKNFVESPIKTEKSLGETVTSAIKAITKDFTDPTAASSTFGGEYKHLQEWFKTTKVKLSEQDKRNLMRGVSRIANSKLKTSEQRLEAVQGFVSRYKPLKDLDKPIPVKEVKQPIPSSKAPTTKPVDVTPVSSTPVFTPIPKDVTKIIKDKPLSVSRLREVWVNSRDKIDRIQKVKGVKVKEGADPTTAHTLSFGRTSSRIEEAQAQTNKIIREVSHLEKKSKNLYEDVQKYLHAKHAPERNAAGKFSGMTDEVASQELARISNLSNSKDVVRVANSISELSNKTLDILIESQVIDRKLYDNLRNKYKNYIPLNRVFEDEGLAQNFNASLNSSIGIKMAKGSEKPIDDIITSVATNVETAINLAEKNRVALETLAFARNNKQLGLFTEIHPRIKNRTKSGKPIFEKIKVGKGTGVIPIRENGKLTFLQVADKNLADVYMDLNKRELGTGAGGDIFRFVAKGTRLISGLSTRFSLEFPVANFIKDTQEVAADLASRKGIGIKGATKFVADQVLMNNARTVMDVVWGKGLSKNAKLYKQMVSDGGTTGSFSSASRADVSIDVEKMRKIANSMTRKTAHGFVEKVDKLNKVFEDASRFGAYKRALKDGKTRTQAAVIAKESSLNFNTTGKVGPVLQALYSFGNVGIQGPAKMIRIMKRNPKATAAITGSIFVASEVLNSWNYANNPNWTKMPGVDFDRKNNAIFVLPTSDGKFEYIKIPVAGTLKPIKMVADMFYDSHTGRLDKSATEIADELVGITVDTFNPVGGKDVISAATPSVADIPLDLLRNKPWYSNQQKIAPTAQDLFPHKKVKEEDVKDSDKYWPNLRKTSKGQYMIAITDALSETGIELSPAKLKYIVDQAPGGAGRDISNVSEMLKSVVTGDELDSNNILFLRRLYRSVPKDLADKAAKMTEKSSKQTKIIQDANSSRLEELRTADAAFEQWKKAGTRKEKSEIIKTTIRHDFATYERLMSYIDSADKGLDGYQRQIILLPAPTRARIIVDILERVEDIQRKELYNEYIIKDLIDGDTMVEMRKLGFNIKGAKR